MPYPVSFDVTEDDASLIDRIVRRAVKLRLIGPSRRARQSLAMDVTAVHANGCPLRLADLLAAYDFEFAHDIGGIRLHLDRTTGELRHNFDPRFATPTPEPSPCG